LSRLKQTRDDVTEGMDGVSFSAMGEKLVSFTRDEFADYAIECFKLVKEESLHGKEVMMYTLLTLLKLWHPYIPFITEALTQSIAGDLEKPKEFLMTSEWPTCDYPLDRESEASIKSIFDVITTIRTIRGERRIKPGDLVDIILYVNPRDRIVLEKNAKLISGLGKAQTISFTLSKDTLEREKYTYGIAGEVEIFVDTSICNHDDDIERLQKLIAEKEDYVRVLEIKLLDPSFVGKAPDNVIRLTQEKKEVTLRQIEKAKEELEQYKS
jgi:valyl-tRNA synthetase